MNDTLLNISVQADHLETLIKSAFDTTQSTRIESPSEKLERVTDLLRIMEDQVTTLQAELSKV